MNTIPHWSRRRFLVLGCVALAAIGVLAAGITTWRATGAGDRVTFADVVGAVMVRGSVFHAACSTSVGGAVSTETFEQWYSPDLGATRTEIRDGGKPLVMGLVTVREGVDLSVDTRSLSRHESQPNVSGMGLGQPEVAVVHIGGLAATKDVAFVRRAGSGGRALVEATARRIRPPSEAGEDEPAGSLQMTAWKLDGRTLLPLSAHFVETRPDGSNVVTVDVTCNSAELVDATTVDPLLFDIDALKKQATSP